MEATADELLGLIQRMYPREFDRAQAELLIQKQQERIADLELQISSGMAATVKAPLPILGGAPVEEPVHGHSHPHDADQADAA